MDNLNLITKMIQDRLPYSCISDVSEQTHVSPATLYYWCNHDLKRPSASVLKRLAHYYGITLTFERGDHAR